jgi:hypothetical protein
MRLKSGERKEKGMNTRSLGAAFGVAAVLAAGVWAAPPARGRPPDAQAAATAGADDAEINEAMRLFQGRPGLGSLRDVVRCRRGLEERVYDLSQQSLSADELAERKDDIDGLAEVCQKVSMVLRDYKPDMRHRAGDPANWGKFTDDMDNASADLAKAVGGGDPKQVKTAAVKLAASCSNCHCQFRD